jgi:hypothetical protein
MYRYLKNALHGCVLALSLNAVGCGSRVESNEALGHSAQALSSPSAFGFEDAVDWSAAGLTLASANEHTEGVHSLSVPAQSYTVVESKPLEIGAVSHAQVLLDIRLPAAQQNPHWYGTLELALSAPSVGLYNAYQGQASLQPLPLGAWATSSFTLSADTVARLAQGARDVSVRLILNVPSGNAAYLVDNLRLGGASGGSPGAPDPGSGSAELKLPHGYGPADLALLAAGTLRLADRVRVSSNVEGRTTIANVGTGSTELGVESRTDTVLSLAGVRVAEAGVVSGELHHVGPVTPQSTASIAKDVPRTTLPTKPFSVHVPAAPTGSHAGVSVDPDSLYGPLAPGAYPHLRVASRASLTLTSGSYSFDDLALEPQSRLLFDDAAGPIYIRVKRSLTLRGELGAVGAPDPRLLWLFDGEGSVSVEAPLRGSLLAPRASVRLATLHGTAPQHRGAVLSRDLQVDPDVRFVHVGFRWLSTKAQVSPSSACLGQPVTVSVETAGPASTIQHYIDGVPGSSRLLQFDGLPGPRMVAVSTMQGGISETELVRFEVRDCGSTAVLPVIAASTSLQGPERVQFVVNNPDVFGEGATYYWQFGDGTTERTSTPAVVHDYVASLSNTEPLVSFTASVTVLRADGTAATSSSTIGLWNQYAASRLKGRLQPPTSASVTVNNAQLSVEALVSNLEPDGVRFTRRRVELQSCTTSASTLRVIDDTIDFSVAARQAASLSVSFPASSATETYCSLAIHLEGNGANGVPAWASAHVPLPGRDVKFAVQGTALTALLQRAVSEGWVGDKSAVSEEDLQRFVAEGRITETELADAAKNAVSATPLPKDTADPPVAGEECQRSEPVPPGYACVPSSAKWIRNGPPQLINAKKGDVVLSRNYGLVGELLAQTDPRQQFDHTGIMVEDYATLRHSIAIDKRFENFPRGVFGSPSDGLNEVVIKYAWPGTITQSVQGAFTTVNNFNEYDPDPEMGHLGKGEYYSVLTFVMKPIRQTTSAPLVYPQVVKPPPGYDDYVMSDGRTVRQALHAAADAAKDIKGHYRFYAYTDGTIVQDPTKVAPALLRHLCDRVCADGGTSCRETDKICRTRAVDSWVAGKGTVPTVCSVFIWEAMKRANITTLNRYTGPAACSDPQQPFEQLRDCEPVDAATPDGLFFYSVEKRKRGAKHLHKSIYNQGASQWGDLAWMIEWGTDAFDDIASQLTNCFVSDWCSEAAKDSHFWKHAWEEPGVGRTVSPSDIAMWDTPEQGGVLGHIEPLVFRNSSYQPMYVWQPVAAPGTGQVTVDVYDFEGNVVQGAQVTAGPATAVTDALGRATFTLSTEVHAVRAFAFVDSVGVEAHGSVTPLADQTVTLTLRLSQPEPEDRLITIVSTHRVVDDDWTWDEINTEARIHTLRVGPNLTDKVEFSTCSDEVRVEVEIEAKYEASGGVTVSATQVLFESVTCGNDDEDGATAFPPVDEVTIANRSTGILHGYVENNDEYSDGTTDRAYLDLSIFVDPFYDQPRDLHRVDITGTLRLKDDDVFDERKTVQISHGVVLHANQRIASWTYDACVGGEVVGEVTATFTLTQAGTIDVHRHYHLYEGTFCGTREGEEGSSADFTLAVGASHLDNHELTNNGDDEAEFTLTFEHRRIE